MKPLILILLASMSLEAQNIADAARQERARQTQYKSTRVFTDANAHSLNPIAPSATPAASGKNATVVASTSPAVPAVDPAAEEMQKLRLKVRALEDQETSLKLQINDVTGQVYAPQTDSTTHNEALLKLGESQARLADVQKELAQARSNLQQMEAQAAPKK
jgi:chromosome segregation ATPase